MRLSECLDKYKVIAAAKKLRSFAEFKNVYINPDRTEAERELERQLRQKRDTLNKEKEEKPNEGRHCIWYIRGDKLFKTDKKPNAGANGKPTGWGQRKAHWRGQRKAHWRGQREAHWRGQREAHWRGQRSA